MTALRILESARPMVRNIARAAAVHAYEVGALASTAAMAPLSLVGGGFEPASSVSPHTKAHAAPTARPVLLVHGFGDEVELVRDRPGPKRPRHHRQRDYLQPIGKFCGRLADELVAAVKRLSLKPVQTKSSGRT